MRLQSLKHIVEVVKALLHPEEITVLGSSALLASDSRLGEAGCPLELSLDADLLIEPSVESMIAIAHEAVGEASLFHQEYGVYADFMNPSIIDTFPDGWRKRCIYLDKTRSVRCLHPIDIAVIKLTLGRVKDMELLKSLLAAGIIDTVQLRKAYQATPMDETTMFRAGRNLRRLEDESGATSGDVPEVVKESKVSYKASKIKRRKARE